MSFSAKFSFKKKDEPESKNDANGPKLPEAKSKQKVKQHPLLNAKHGLYADDGELYTQKLSREDRNTYWLALLNNRGKRVVPSGFKSWMSKEIATDHEGDNYPLVYTFLFNVSSSLYWDHWTLNLFIIFLLVVVGLYDGWKTKYLPQLDQYIAGDQLLMYIALGMFICQLIPPLGMWYLTHYCNDLVLFKGALKFQSWAFGAALMAQYVEYFYYGGQNHRDLASNCRFGHPKNNHTVLVYAKNYFASTTRRHSQIHLQQLQQVDGEEGGHQNNDEQSVDRSLSELGSMTSDDPKHKKKNRHNKHQHTKHKDGADHPAGDIENQSHQSQQSSMNEGGEDNQQQMVVKRDLTRSQSETGFEAYKEFLEGQEEESKEEDIEYMDWTCVVCKRENHLPRHPKIESDIVFGTKGVYYKRTYAVIQPRKDMPSCAKCLTYADYKPPGSSAHTFPHNPEPFAVFEAYPRETTVAPGLKIDEHSLRYQNINSFFFGLRNSVYSTPVLNDWRLRKYVMDKYPEIPRQKLPHGEFFQLGEIVECKQQKFDWCRARIIGVKKNHSYDIRYDGGDELRFVSEAAIRLRPEKGGYAYRVEICMVLAAVLLPLGLTVACMGNPSILFIGPLIMSVVLLSIRIVLFVQYFHNYYNAGLCTILRTSSLFALPLLFLMITSVVAASTPLGSPAWVSVAILFILTKAISLPVLYMIRPPYALMGAVIFLQTSIGFYILALYVSGQMPAGSYIAIPLAPLVSTALCLKYVRRNLDSIWDVCLIIRPHRDTRQDNPSILSKVKEDLEAYFNP